MKSRLHHSPKIETSKCVRLKDGTGIILRMPNEQARLQVSTGFAVYVPKKEWKAQLAEYHANQEKKAA